MKSKLVTAALLAIAGFAIVDLIRAAIFPNAATFAVDTSRPEPALSPVAAVEPPSTPTPDGGAPSGALASSNDLVGEAVEAVTVRTLEADRGAKERRIVIQPGSDLVVIETEAEAGDGEPRAAIIPASIGEAAASEAGALKASAETGDTAPPRVSTALPAPADLLAEPAPTEPASGN